MTDMEGLWVRSDVLPDGSYGVTVNCGEDAAWTLTREQAIDYAVNTVAMAVRAEHDGAVVALLTQRLDMPLTNAVEFLVHEVWPTRVDLNDAPRLRFQTALGERGPFIKMQLDGAQIGELTTSDLRDHGQGVLMAIAAADLDAALMRVLMGKAEVEEHIARSMIADLADYWPKDKPPRRFENAPS